MKTVVALPGEGIGIEVVAAGCELMTAAGMPVKILTPPHRDAAPVPNPARGPPPTPTKAPPPARTPGASAAATAAPAPTAVPVTKEAVQLDFVGEII